MKEFTLAMPWFAVLLGLVVWVVTAWICWTHWKRHPRPSVAFLETLRFVLVTLLLFSLLQPEFVQQEERTELPKVVVLADHSGSMETRDVLTTTNQVMTRSAWLAQQKSANAWQTLELGHEVVYQPFSNLSTHPNSNGDLDSAARPDASAANETVSSASGTDLNRALQDAIRQHRQLKAVLLLTDGDWNVGHTPLSAATRYQDRNIPIFSAAVGQESHLPDLELSEISAASYGLLGEQITVPFTVTSYMTKEIATTAQLVVDGETVASRSIELQPMGQVRETLLWMPREVGDKRLEIRIPVQEGEVLSDNNQQEFPMQIRLETLKVLVVDSLPRWEYRFLRNALERDPGVEMHCILFHPGMGTGGGRNYLEEFPSSRDQITRYDVLFLGDVGLGEGELTADQLELVRGLVEQQGSGLVFLPGSRGRIISFQETALQELLPVVLNEAKPEGMAMTNPSQLVLTSDGVDHWLTRFAGEEQENRMLWEQLPGFYWSAPVEKSRPGSQVLAVHSSLRNAWGRAPLLVTRPFGAGQVLFMGTDNAWRWRLGVEDKYHYRFWSQVVRWMAHRRHQAQQEGMRLSYSPETPQAGDKVHLQVTVLDQAGFPVNEGPVRARMVRPNGSEEALDFQIVEGGWGVFRTSFTAEQGGPHRLNLQAEAAERDLETRIYVEAPELEKIGRPVNGSLLRELASLTGGKSVSYSGLREIVDQIQMLPEPQPATQRVRLWSHPAWGGFILTLLVVYWVGRKWFGMI